MRKSILVLAAVILVVAGGSAEAAHLITSADIKDGTIKGQDIHGGTISLSKLTRSVQKAIKNGTKLRVQQGPAGANGANGTNGVNGKDGAPGKDATTLVSSLTGDFSATNASVTLTPGGVQFGPYADNSHGGSVEYTGINGAKLKDIAQLAYTAGYSESPDTHCDAPYLRVFLNGDVDDVDFSPDSQGSGSPTVASGKTVHYDVTQGVVRYDDDAGDGSGPYGLNGAAWDTVVNDHSNDTVSGVYVSDGFACGGNLSAWLNSLTVEAKGQRPDIFSFSG
jgi:hypothetical protein